MVRINLIHPKYLADQHLLAEHVEILMLITSAKKYDYRKVPPKYKLGTGHINFFKNKLKYIHRRFKLIQTEMRERGFKVNVGLPNYNGISLTQIKDYTPDDDALEIIKERLIEKLSMKPDYYTYYGDKYDLEHWIQMIKESR